MKTKYIKVAVSERLPDQQGLYITNLGVLLFYANIEGSKVFKSLRTEEEVSESKISFWLEEVPDREQEMKDMMERIRENQYSFGEITDLTIINLEELLNSIK